MSRGITYKLSKLNPLPPSLPSISTLLCGLMAVIAERIDIRLFVGQNDEGKRGLRGEYGR
jgi:hypothetical protein